jgi:gluconate 2-dehydrogenase
MKPSVLLYQSVKEQTLSRFKQHCDVAYFPEGRTSANQQQFDECLAKAQAIIGSGIKVDAAFLDKAPHLKVAATISVGYDNYDLDTMTRRKILLTHTPDILTDTTADAIFGLMMATARRIPELDQLVKTGNWKKMIGREFYGCDIHHKTLGIIGMGRIGQAIAKRGYGGFDMKILYTNRSAKPEVEQQFAAERCELEELLKRSDFVCLIISLTDDTKNMIDSAQLALMKSSAIIINGARGPVINEQALINALKNKQIRAAGLDVYNVEPLPSDSALLKLDNVVTLPHIGSATTETREAMADIAVDNVIKGLDGSLSKNMVNPQVIGK